MDGKASRHRQRWREEWQEKHTMTEFQFSVLATVTLSLGNKWHYVTLFQYCALLRKQRVGFGIQYQMTHLNPDFFNIYCFRQCQNVRGQGHLPGWGSECSISLFLPPFCMAAPDKVMDQWGLELLTLKSEPAQCSNGQSWSWNQER